MDQMVEVTNLGKNIKGIDVVKDITFSVEKRDILGFRTERSGKEHHNQDDAGTCQSDKG